MSAILRRAATLLREEAAAHRESCQIGRPGRPVQDWACADCPGRNKECPARARHDLLQQTANAVERVAKRQTGNAQGTES